MKQQGDSVGELVEVEDVIKSNSTRNLLNCKNAASKAQTNVSSTKFTIKKSCSNSVLNKLHKYIA